MHVYASIVDCLVKIDYDMLCLSMPSHDYWYTYVMLWLVDLSYACLCGSRAESRVPFVDCDMHVGWVTSRKPCTIWYDVVLAFVVTQLFILVDCRSQSGFPSWTDWVWLHEPGQRGRGNIPMPFGISLFVNIEVGDVTLFLGNWCYQNPNDTGVLLYAVLPSR